MPKPISTMFTLKQYIEKQGMGTYAEAIARTNVLHTTLLSSSNSLSVFFMHHVVSHVGTHTHTVAFDKQCAINRNRHEH